MRSPDTTEARAALARRQRELVDAVVVGGPVPPGFDAHRVEIARSSLVDKRRDEVASQWPAVVASLGADFAPRFAAYAGSTAAPVEGGPWADGLAFVTSRVARRELDADARTERDQARAIHAIVRGRLVRRGAAARRMLGAVLLVRHRR